MGKDLLWKRAVRRGLEHARREPRNANFDQACELTAMVIENMRNHLAGSETLTEQELDRRVSLYRIRVEQMEQRVAATWRQVEVTE